MTDMHAYCKNRILIQSLALMRSAINLKFSGELNPGSATEFVASAENLSPQTNAAIDGIVAMKLYIDV